MSNLSNGFFIYSNPLVVICVYISVVFEHESQNCDCMCFKSVPDSNSCVPNYGAI